MSALEGEFEANDGETGSERERHYSRPPITRTKFWNTLMEDVYGKRKGGAILFLDSENARKGVGKTSCGVALARLFAKAFGYDLQKDDLTLSAKEYLQRYRSHPGKEQPSVLLIDEFVGAGAGDKRRAMAQQNLDFGSAWQMLRQKRVVTIAVLPDWNAADKRLKKLADYRVWCREKPIGVFQPYKVTVPFSSDGANTVRTTGLNYAGGGARRIHFPNMDAKGCEYYQHLTRKKSELIHSETWDADQLEKEKDDASDAGKDPDEIRREERIRQALHLTKPWDDEDGESMKKAAMSHSHSRTWINNRVQEWRDGEWRHLFDADGNEIA